jgi:hypothetical protein
VAKAREATIVTDSTRKVLHAAGATIVFSSIAVQAWLLAFYWWNFDPRTSCDRLPYWGEWITCLQGISHLHIVITEMAISSWLVAGIAMLPGRFLPPYISILGPGAIGAALISYAMSYWHETVTPYADFDTPTFWSVFRFAIEIGAVGIQVLAPVAGAWLLGLSARVRRRSLLTAT